MTIGATPIAGSDLVLILPTWVPPDGDWLYVDANCGLNIPPQEHDWLYVDANCGLNIPPQDDDWLYVDGDVVKGAGYVLYPIREVNPNFLPATRY